MPPTLNHLTVDLRHRQGGGWLADFEWHGENDAGRPTSGHGQRAFGAACNLAWAMRTVAWLAESEAGR